MNFGEGFETVSGTWHTVKGDASEIFVFLDVTSTHIGLSVCDLYCLILYPKKSNVLVLTDSNAGIAPDLTKFTLKSFSSSPTAEDISASRAKIRAAVKANGGKLASNMKAAADSGYSCSGYRGLVLDSWAIKEVGMAAYIKLMPTEVNDYFHEPITRRAFAALIQSALLNMSGMTEAQLENAVTVKSFPDSSSQKVGICAGLGIITGYDSGYFLPENTITRQEAATMLSRMADTVGAVGTGNVLTFTDISGLWGESYIRSASTMKDTFTGNAPLSSTASSDKLYIGNNKVLVISAFAKNNSHYQTPLNAGIEAIRAKGYEITEVYDATLADFAKMGGGGYGMVILISHGEVYDNTFYLCLESDASTKPDAQENTLLSNGAYVYNEITLGESGSFNKLKRAYYVSPKFFSHYLKEATLDDAYVQMISCSGMKTNQLAQAFLDNGAKAVTGYTDVAKVAFAAKALELTASNMLPVKNQKDSAINIGELEASVLKKAGVNAFYINDYSHKKKNTVRRAVLTRFVATGNTEQILGVEEEAPDYDGAIVTATGTFYSKAQIGGVMRVKIKTTYTNISDLTLTGIGIVQFRNNNVANPHFENVESTGTKLYKNKDLSDFSLAPGESYTCYLSYISKTSVY